MFYEQKFLFSLLLTLTIEIPVVVLLVKYLYKQKEIKISKIIFVGFIANALTLPYLWFILPAHISSRLLYVLIGEISAFLIEAIIYKELLDIKINKALIISLIANLTSFLLGLLIFSLNKF